MKKTEKIISLIENGYGLIQTMEHPEVNIGKVELLALMEENAELNKKMRKRFGDEIFEVEEVEKEPENGENENSDPEQSGDEPEQKESENGEPDKEPEGKTEEPSDIDALKAEADALGIKYNPMIGADKLRARIEEFKANK